MPTYTLTWRAPYEPEWSLKIVADDPQLAKVQAKRVAESSIAARSHAVVLSLTDDSGAEISRFVFNPPTVRDLKQ